MRRSHSIGVLCLATCLGVAANAQTTLTVLQQEVGAEQPASEVRQEFWNVMIQYPSSLRNVLQIDPTLLLDPNFLEPYPTLSSFLELHPEVVHNPVYFLGTSNSGDGISEEVAMVLVFLTIVSVAIWLIRTLVDYVRWSRASRVQAEVQTKLLDRFSGSQDLLAYLETPAGSRLLDATPAPSPNAGSAPGAPTSRILWSIQVGLVLAMGGGGLHFAIPRLANPGAADPLYVIGTLAIALGVGFLLSAALSLVLSQRLGLIAPAKPTPPDTAGQRPS